MPTLTAADIDDTLSAEFIQLTDREHGMEKSMHLGSHKVASHEIYALEGNALIKGKHKFSQVFYKMFDEILVNAIDVAMKYKTVKSIDVSFDEKTGAIAIANDGRRGIPCGVVKTSDGTPIYVPEMLFTHFRAGSNHKKCQSTAEVKDNISTGVNGFGCKLVVVNSGYTKVVTHDTERKVRYEQEFKSQMAEICEPNIQKLKRGQQGTTVSYTAHWPAFIGWPKKFGSSIFDVMDPIFRARVIFASAYTGIDIQYNGTKFGVTNAWGLAKYFAVDPFAITVKPKTTPPGTNQIYPWNICFDVGAERSEVVSVVNGACVSAGQHLEHITDQLIGKLRPKIERMFNKSKIKYQKRMITNYLTVVFVGIIPNIEFDSQLKTKLV